MAEIRVGPAPPGPLPLAMRGADDRWDEVVNLVLVFPLLRAPARCLREAELWLRLLRFGHQAPTLQALGERRFGDLHRLNPTAAEETEQLQEELAASLAHLQRVDAVYWEREWRREHKGLGIYPEDHLWRATHGYLDLLAANQTRRHLS